MNAMSQLQGTRRFAARAPLLALLLGVAQSSAAATFAVNSTADARDADLADGICATASGTCTLRAAVEQSNALAGADVVNLPAGTYAITLGNGDDNAERGDFDVTDSLTINGAGRFATIVDGNNADRVFDVHENASLRIWSLTIRRGNVNNQGGAIRSEGALVANDLRIENNVSGGEGGGIAVRKNGASASLTDVEFLGNVGDKGAGLHVKDDTSVTLSSVIFEANIADKDGGGAYIDDALAASLSDVSFDGNSAEKGGALYVKDVTSLTLVDVSMVNNAASKEGGGVYLDKTAARIERSLVATNSAEEGGGLFIKGGDSSVDITNVTISSNSASKEGGGIHKEGNGSTRLINVTINGNGSPRGGGLRGKDGLLSVLNTIIANSPGGGDCDGDVVSLGYNLDSDGSCTLGQAGDLPGTNPLLNSLQDNGGPTHTHGLADFSPARDTADTARCPGIDQRSRARPVDGNADGIADCDIGAFEAELLYPDYTVNKGVSVTSDPVSGDVDPHAIPGAVMQYAIQISNDGPGTADADSLVITDAVPANTVLRVADFDTSIAGPVAFIDGVPASGLTYSFTSLDSDTDDVEFSDDGGASFNYAPTVGGDGSDPAVTHIRIRPKGLAPFTGTDPVAEFYFKVIVR